MNIFPEDQIRIVTDEKILRQVSHETSFKEVLSLKLFDRLQAANEKAWTGGVGLAAIQIGVPVRCAFYKRSGQVATFLINPVIRYGQNLVSHHGEGCLSIQDRRFQTWRYNKIVYEKLMSGKMQEYKAEGFEAFIIQHEVDHMNGILCCDRTVYPHGPKRNEICLCGSGKKYKKCCIEKGVPL